MLTRGFSVLFIISMRDRKIRRLRVTLNDETEVPDAMNARRAMQLHCSPFDTPETVVYLQKANAYTIVGGSPLKRISRPDGQREK
jgi:hypothetical protein